MIEFHCSKFDEKNRNTPILKDVEIDEMAEMLLRDYRPQLLREPAAINYLHFLESYLGATMEFCDIFYKEEEGPIWGATAFNKETLKIFDQENLCTRKIRVDSRTISIDNSVMVEGKEGLALFTGLHEGGHLWMHPGVYSECSAQLGLFDSLESQSIICCRRKQFEGFGGQRNFVTAEQWREHQANYFASAVAMPKSTFVPLCRDFLKSEGIRDGRIVTGFDRQHDRIALFDLPCRISETYGVSHQAASIKLKKFGVVVDKALLRQGALL